MKKVVPTGSPMPYSLALECVGELLRLHGNEARAVGVGRFTWLKILMARKKQATFDTKGGQFVNGALEILGFPVEPLGVEGVALIF